MVIPESVWRFIVLTSVIISEEVIFCWQRYARTNRSLSKISPLHWSTFSENSVEVAWMSPFLKALISEGVFSRILLCSHRWKQQHRRNGYFLAGHLKGTAEKVCQEKKCFSLLIHDIYEWGVVTAVEISFMLPLLFSIGINSCISLEMVIIGTQYFSASR